MKQSAREAHGEGRRGQGHRLPVAIEARASLRGFYRAAHVVPFMATMAALAIGWEAALHPTIGLVNHLLGWFLHPSSFAE